MALTCIQSSGEKLVGPEVEDFLRGALAERGRAVLLLPTFAQALEASRALAAAGGLSLGVTVTTPSAWASERWEVWGDGRRLVDPASRQLLSSKLLKERAGRFGTALACNAGSAALLADLARKGLPWLTARGSAEKPGGVTPAEAELVGLLPSYASLLESHGLVEECEVMAILPGLLKANGAQVPSVVACLGPGRPARPVRELLEGLGANGFDVTLVEAAPTGCADEPDRAPELSALAASLFDATAPRLTPTGALRLLIPAGPSARAALTADEVVGLAEAGAAEIVVAAPDARAAARELTPRLTSRGFSVRVQLSETVAKLESGRAFLELASSVAKLSGLARTWPEPVPVTGGVRVAVDGQDMSWWPPRALSDFAASAISHVSPDRARALDAQWRSNRLLTPPQVLEQLQTERLTSPETAAATRELLRGRIGSAASKLLAPFVQGEKAGDPAAEDVRAGLSAVLAAAKTCKELGLTADQSEPGAIELTELVDAVADLLGRTNAQLRLERRVENPRGRVRIMGLSDAALLPPCSVDALVLLGQTSSESPVGSTDDVLSALLAAYDVDEPEDPMQLARERFAAQVRAPRKSLALERPLFGADGKPAYPGVMLTELLACYGISADAKPAEIAGVLGEGGVSSAGELALAANASDSGSASDRVRSDAPAPAGRVSESSRELVLPPPEGVDVGGNVPVLSASQIETYLECPYKWFSLRRLKLADADAGFGGAETGTFAHRVLEVAHEELLARAVEVARGTSELTALAEADPDGTQSEAYREKVAELVAAAQGDPAARVPGSRVTSANLDAARVALDEEFEAHLSHMYQLVRGKKPLPQALVPHTASDLGKLERLRRDLEDLLEFESASFAGYEPRFFEWSFGRDAAEPVEYAGVRVMGTIDRVDVDAHGQAIVIDYKHKSASGFASEYDVFAGGAPEEGEPFQLPRRVQSLIYGQVVRRAHPELRVRAAVYLCTRSPQAIAGAVDEEAADAVFGENPVGAKRLSRVAVPRSSCFGQEDATGMDALLDACEEAVAERVAELLAGNIEARPLDAHACEFCPVLDCERRVRA